MYAAITVSLSLPYLAVGRLTKEVNDTAGVAPFVVVPRDELDEVVVEGDTGLGVEGGGVVVAVEIGGDDVVFGVSEDTYRQMLARKFAMVRDEHAFQVALCSLLHGRFDLIVRRWLLEHTGQIDDGDVGGRNTHGHSSKFAIELGDDFANGFSGPRAAGDDVLSSSSASTPVLA